MKPKRNLTYYPMIWIFMLAAGCARTAVFEARPPELINKAEQDLNQAEIEANRQRSALPETMIAEDQLKKAKELEGIRTEVVARNGVAAAPRKITANDVSLTAAVSSLNSKIAIIRAKEADLAEQNSKLEFDLARLQADANKQWSEINKAQIELGVSSRAELEKRLEEEHQARAKTAEQLEASQKAREEAARQAEAQRQGEMEQMRASTMMEDYRRQQAELERKLNSLSQEFMKTREEQRGIIVSLSGALFDVDRFTLQPGSAERLNILAQLLRDYPDRRILVEGHTDSTGQPDYNQVLSEKRANTVMSYLVSNGINPAKIETKGYGDKLPVATNDTMAGRQLNRRVDIVILNPPEAEMGKPGEKG